MAHSPGVLVTGASGYLGSLIVATLLRSVDVRLLLPVRGGPERAIIPLSAELAATGRPLSLDERKRLEIVTLPSEIEVDAFSSVMRAFGVDDVVHCAACLDYYNHTSLQATNVELTRQLTMAASAAGIRRFVYLSTAFSSGYIDKPVAEAIHAEPDRDPTEYTKTKRAAERVVAESGLPYQIIRPSIVIGDSRDGHYSGKRYGLYQLWSGLERLLSREWHPEIHVFAPSWSAAHLVHQDAFQAAFLAAYRWLPSNTILNLASNSAVAPPSRALWEIWLDACHQPLRTIFYDRMSDIPIRSIPPAQRALLALASVNLELIGHPWLFETNNLESLRRGGLEFRDATLDTIKICQTQFIRQSSTIQRFLAQRGQSELSSANTAA